MSGAIYLGLGANLAGEWGDPGETIAVACARLAARARGTFNCAALLETAPVGPQNQPRYVNTVCRFDVTLSPDALLRWLKQLERAAGRGAGRRWGPRPLDIDILDYRGLIRGWPALRKHARASHGAPRARRTPAILPHPEMHRRTFVLEPLGELDPDWRHPVLHRTAAGLLADLETAGTARPEPG